MNILNLPMLDSAVTRKMTKDKEKGTDDKKDGKRAQVPQEYQHTLEGLGIEVKKQRVEKGGADAKSTKDEPEPVLEPDPSVHDAFAAMGASPGKETKSATSAGDSALFQTHSVQVLTKYCL